jgi:hypothetical protein
LKENNKEKLDMILNTLDNQVINPNKYYTVNIESEIYTNNHVSYSLNFKIYDIVWLSF